MGLVDANENYVVISGKVKSKKKFSHSIFGEKIYTSSLGIMRLSEYEDNIPITISERLLLTKDLEIGDNVIIKGQIRSYNSYENGKDKLDLTIFAKEIEWVKEQEEKMDSAKNNMQNEVRLQGYICKQTTYRKTPSGREITDLLLAVNRAYSKSDYIPTITWGRNARNCKNIPVGMRVKVIGRIQSREYEKKLVNGCTEIRTAYELSVDKMDFIN